jgi:hypothetical protein
LKPAGTRRPEPALKVIKVDIVPRGIGLFTTVTPMWAFDNEGDMRTGISLRLSLLRRSPSIGVFENEDCFTFLQTVLNRLSKSDKRWHFKEP